jgi:hypothetical protein
MVSSPSNSRVCGKWRFLQHVSTQLPSLDESMYTHAIGACPWAMRAALQIESEFDAPSMTKSRLLSSDKKMTPESLPGK